MSLLDQQLKRWKSADLITADQADRIRTFEERRPRREFVLAVAVLGGFAVALGLLSIVAAHWARLSGHTKLALDLLAVAGCGQAVVLARRRAQASIAVAVQRVHLADLSRSSLAQSRGDTTACITAPAHGSSSGSGGCSAHSFRSVMLLRLHADVGEGAIGIG
jgi:hypothetical protein